MTSYRLRDIVCVMCEGEQNANKARLRACLLVFLFSTGSWSACGQVQTLAQETGHVYAIAASPRSSGPVSVSLQNELNAAMDRGTVWLLHQQNADGSWGLSNRIGLTAVATLALTQRAAHDACAAKDRAAAWLEQAGTQTETRREDAAAWREIALAVVRAQTSAQSHTTIAVSSTIHTNNLSPAVRMLLDDRSEMGSQAPHSQAASSATLSLLAARWTPQGPQTEAASGRMQSLWLAARQINRTGGGVLADTQGRVIDWRNDLAKVLVDSQSVDAQLPGAGFWHSAHPASEWDSQPIAETAFAILAMGEL